ncbi:MAG: GTP cyclohydrolase I FolE [Epsilonproteobacteria bacterium]|nr:MAG: GTP cyclohydrolase I FolE [Campylobacterota bacterium]
MKKAVEEILKHVGEDISRDGLKDTPQRVQNAWEFLCSGYDIDPKKILNKALFDTTNQQMVVLKNIKFYSMCEHHMLPIIGKASIAYIPNGKVVGLSKIPRIVDIYARRLQIQEQLTKQIADTIYDVIKPKGVAVMIKARHMCMEMRGVQKQSNTITSSLNGLFQTNDKTRAEFFKIIT